jgi:hypothetical protein
LCSPRVGGPRGRDRDQLEVRTGTPGARFHIPAKEGNRIPIDPTTYHLIHAQPTVAAEAMMTPRWVKNRTTNKRAYHQLENITYCTNTGKPLKITSRQRWNCPGTTLGDTIGPLPRIPEPQDLYCETFARKQSLYGSYRQKSLGALLFRPRSARRP